MEKTVPKINCEYKFHKIKTDNLLIVYKIQIVNKNCE